MYQDHQPKIAAFASQSSDNFVDVGLLCILSARMPFARVSEDFATVKGGDHAPLFAWKSEAYFELRDEVNARRYKLAAMNDRRNEYIRRGWQGMVTRTETEMLSYVLTWFGFNLVKGGFFLQMVYGISGCLDVRNENTYDLQERATRAVPAVSTRRNRDRKAAAYNALCRRLGGTETLWDAWCDYYAASGDNEAWETGEDVSAAHCIILGIDPGSANTEADIPF